MPEAPPPPPGPPPRPPPSRFFELRGHSGPLLTLLLGIGVGAVCYGLYDLYTARTHWPPQILRDLRSGLKAKHKNDIPVAIYYLSRAYKTSKTLPLSDFGTDPHLKVSGIAICLAELLEKDGKPELAYDVYYDALVPIQAEMPSNQNLGNVGPPELSGPEHLRGIALAYKLGELAGGLQRPQEEEKHLVWAVEAIIPTIIPTPQYLRKEVDVLDQELALPLTEPAPKDASSVPPSKEHEALTIELSLPDWATKTDFAAPFEALGTFYAQNGRIEYAVPLYLQTISILLTPDSATSSTEERCRAAQVMSNLSEVLIRARSRHEENRRNRKESLDLPSFLDDATSGDPNQIATNIFAQAEAWATKGLELSSSTREERQKARIDSDPTCEVAYAVALFNVAALRKMAGDKEKARQYFMLSLNQSKAIGMQDGVIHGEEALRQLEQNGTEGFIESNGRRLVA